MTIAIQVLSIITLSIIVLTFAIVISRLINLSAVVDALNENIQEITIEKAEEMELRDQVENFTPTNSYGSFGYTKELTSDKK